MKDYQLKKDIIEAISRGFFVKAFILILPKVKHKYSLEIKMKRHKFCRRCGHEKFNKRPNAIYCKECAEKVLRERRRVNSQRYNKEHRKRT